MKKVFKEKGVFSGKEITYTVSEKLNKLDGKVYKSKKVAETNEFLRKVKKPLPDTK